MPQIFNKLDLRYRFYFNFSFTGMLVHTADIDNMKTSKPRKPGTL